MRSVATSVLAVFALSSFAQTVIWPPLPGSRFIVGRAATQADITAGHAIFVTTHGGVERGKPLQIAIPQYAYHIDGGRKIPVIVVQAEEALDKHEKTIQLVGARNLDGQEVIGFLQEFELLGQSKPKSVAP